MSGENVAKMLGLSTEQFTEYKDLFNAFDKDKSGTISKDDLSDLYKKLNVRNVEHMVDAMFHNFDRDGEPELSLAEFLYVMARSANPNGDPPLKRELDKFKSFDKDGDKALSKEEFKQLLSTLGMTAEDVDKYFMFESTDADGDGKISFKECLDYLINRVNPKRGCLRNPYTHT